MPAFLHGVPLAQATLTRPRAHTSEALAHITDWLPTLLGLAGGELESAFSSSEVDILLKYVQLVVIEIFPQPLQQSQLMGTTCGRLSLKVLLLRFCSRSRFHNLQIKILGVCFIICIIKILLWVDFHNLFAQEPILRELLSSTTLTWTTRVELFRCFLF